MQTEKDPHLWEIAKKRASFKYNVATYVVVNIFLWAIWWFTGSRSYGDHHLPWPVWPTFGWGIGLVFHYLGAYVFSREDGAEKEYEKLTRNKQS
jgi:hypothetical protein